MITYPNQEQLMSLLRTVLQIIGAYIVAHNTMGADSAKTWEVVSGGILILAPTIWSMFAHSQAAQIKNVAAMDDVAKVVKADDAPANSAVAKLAADPTQTKVVPATT